MRGLSVLGVVLLVAGLGIFFGLVEPSLTVDQERIDAPGLVFLGVSLFLMLGGIYEIASPFVERLKRGQQ